MRWRKSAPDFDLTIKEDVGFEKRRWQEADR
jgi:hypothetical protein